MVRYADGAVLGLSIEKKRNGFLEKLRERLQKFGLETTSGEDAPDRIRALCR
jgi:hypothetical protein